MTDAGGDAGTIPADDQTSVQIEFILEGHGLPPGALAPVRWLMASTVRDVIGQDLEDLQAFIEQSPALQGRAPSSAPTPVLR